MLFSKTARRRRLAPALSVTGVLAMAAAVSAVSAQDPSGVTLRIGMILLTVGLAMWLRWPQLLPAALLVWLAPNFVRSLVQDHLLFGPEMMLELPGMVGLAVFSALAYSCLCGLEVAVIETAQADSAGPVSSLVSIVTPAPDPSPVSPAAKVIAFRQPGLVTRSSAASAPDGTAGQVGTELDEAVSRAVIQLDRTLDLIRAMRRKAA
jgi:hypothetical protein